jgi:AraC family transcriptional regulator
MKNSKDIYQQRINKAIDYINSNLNKSIPLAELASESYFSPYHFHRIFTAVTGESVNEFTNRVRIEKSMRLLKYSKDSISNIAYDCGYSSPSIFSRAFKQYLEVSPSYFRKNGDLNNSKIRKELFPVDQYHCDMNEDELKTNFPVEIKELPQRRIAYIRVLDSYKEGVVIKAFANLIEWAKEVKLFKSETIFGMSLDDPMVTPKEKYRYEVCITIPKNFKVDSPLIQTITLPKCLYATSSVSGSSNVVATAIKYLFNEWLINSSYEPEHQAGLEIFNDKKNILNWEYLDLDLCIPIKKIKAI